MNSRVGVNEMNKIIESFLIVLAVILIVSIIAVIPTWLLWNWLMPVIFGLPEITILQAFGLLILSGLLVKSHNAIKELHKEVMYESSGY